MKLKKINWRKVLLVSLWTIAGLGLIITLGFVNSVQQNLMCKGVNVTLNENVQHDFIDEEEISELIKSREKLIGKPLNSINTSLLEKIIMSNSYVQRAEVYSSVNGSLSVSVTQRNPLVRIITMHNEQFYIDDTGNFMPVSNKYTPSALVANGYLFNRYTEQKINLTQPTVSDTGVRMMPMIEQVYRLAEFIEVDTFWNAQTEQIYVNDNQEMEIIPRVGNHRIVIGDAENLAEKFDKLMIFYKQGLNKTGWNNYNVINLKYRNQVVCTKN